MAEQAERAREEWLAAVRQLLDQPCRVRRYSCGPFVTGERNGPQEYLRTLQDFSDVEHRVPGHPLSRQALGPRLAGERLHLGLGSRQGRHVGGGEGVREARRERRSALSSGRRFMAEKSLCRRDVGKPWAPRRTAAVRPRLER